MGAAGPDERTWIDEQADRFARAWKAGRGPRIEDFLTVEAGPRRAQLLEELLRVESALRQRAGEEVSPDDYRSRFPGHGPVIDGVFGGRGPEPPPAGPRRPAGSDADRNLLFGVLALQMDFISREALIAAVSAWIRARDKPLAQILVEQGSLPQGRRALLEPLVQEHVRAHGGDPETSLASVSPLGPWRAALAAVADAEVRTSLEHVGAARDGDPDRTASWPAGPPGSPAGRFRILRFLERGGRGEVYVARDEELAREVALKQIQLQLAHDRDARARFLLEAEITGGLEHPGIVPVYSLGHCEDGRPFYAMRFIKGDSLKQAIARFHQAGDARQDPGERALELRRLLGRFLDVCNAVAYAHSRGVLHRDLKPGNILLGPYGETLVVDWGMAKLVGRSEEAQAAGEATLWPPSAGSSAETMAGYPIGTPGYMSPEQAAGRLDQLGPATDVYSLGATLYALLTGRPPFSSREDLNEVIRQVQRGDFPPPRQIQRSVAPALEAICLKAMALRPEDRYPSPRALTEDLERWLGDEPVWAWPEPWPARLARWGRRHRPLVTGIAALLVTAVVALSVGTVVLSRANARSEAHYQMARAAVDRYFTQISESRLLNEPGMEPLRRELLETAREFYQRLVDSRRDDPGARADLGWAYIHLAWITAAVESRTAALRPAEQARSLFARLAAERPGIEEYQRDLAASLDVLGSLLSDLGRAHEAGPLLGQEVRLRERLAAAHPADRSLQKELASGLQNLGGHFHEVDPSSDDARRLLRRAVGIHERLLRERPDDPDYQYALASALGGLSGLERHLGAVPEAVAYRERATELQATLADRWPEIVSYRRQLAAGLGKLGGLYRQSRRSGDRSAVLERSLALREALAREHPAVADYQCELAEACSRLASARDDAERWDEAAGLYRRAADILKGLVGRHREILTYRDDLATVLLNSGVLEQDRNRPAEARRLIGEAIEVLEALCRDDSRSLEFPASLARCYSALGDLESDDRADRLAATWYDRAAGTLEDVLARDPHQALAREYLRDVLWGRARVRARARSFPEAIADCDRALTLDEDGKLRVRLRLHRALMRAYLGDQDRAAAEVGDAIDVTPDRLRPGDFERAARVLSVCSAATTSTAGPVAAERERRREAYASRAIRYLALAHAAGMFQGPEDRADLLHDPGFATLHRRPDFQLLLMDLAFPAQPFTRDD